MQFWSSKLISDLTSTNYPAQRCWHSQAAKELLRNATNVLCAGFPKLWRLCVGNWWVFFCQKVEGPSCTASKGALQHPCRVPLSWGTREVQVQTTSFLSTHGEQVNLVLVTATLWCYPFNQETCLARKDKHQLLQTLKKQLWHYKCSIVTHQI